VLGPALFGITYMATVAIFPRAMFFLAAVAAAVPLVLFSLLRFSEPIALEDVEGREQENMPIEHRDADPDMSS
jgi:hypothetical protein